MDALERFAQPSRMLTRALLLSLVLLVSYGYGVVSHAHRIFPLEELGALRRLVWPESGISTPHGKIFSETEGRRELACDSIDHDAAVVLVMGQSNAANHGETRYRPRGEVYNFDWVSGRCYRAEDPLLGATGDGGSPWTRLGDALIERGIFRQVVLVTVASGGTSIHAWVGASGPAGRAVAAAQELSRRGLPVTHVLWQQGESDKTMDRSSYVRLFIQMTSYLRGNGIDAPIYVAQSTICANRGLEQVREAQLELPKLLAGADVRPGPDLDALDHIRERAPNLCHFSDLGLERAARLWFDVLAEEKLARSLAGETLTAAGHR
jgi:hypothetical protein